MRMEDHVLYNNKAEVCGKVASECVFNHRLYGEEFYTLMLEVPRLSQSSDIIPVTVSGRLSPHMYAVGEWISIIGQIRSYNKYIEGSNRLVLTLFARSIGEGSVPVNHIYLDGYICKPPVYRHTPYGREIADLLLAVNRSYRKSDYIPCIAWSRNARYAADLSVGERIVIEGRAQSREYDKLLPDGTKITRTAYEISIGIMEKAPE
ncbi:MAG: single-stranded DNA-binding protein [Christensenellales bacterium]|jgi:primosomal replication protein N